MFANPFTRQTDPIPCEPWLTLSLIPIVLVYSNGKYSNGKWVFQYKVWTSKGCICFSMQYHLEPFCFHTLTIKVLSLIPRHVSFFMLLFPLMKSKTLLGKQSTNYLYWTLRILSWGGTAKGFFCVFEWRSR